MSSFVNVPTPPVTNIVSPTIILPILLSRKTAIFETSSGMINLPAGEFGFV